MLRRVYWYIVTLVSNDGSAYISMVKHAKTTGNVFTTRQFQDLERLAMTAEDLRPIQTSLIVYLPDDAS